MLRLSRLPTGEPEIFVSIQGEGVTIGLPSVFVRLALCNLRCVWCDTKYTWDWSHYDPKREIVQVDVGEVENRVMRTGVKNVVITGGEPLLQEGALVPLAQALKGHGWRIEVETNGTIVPHELGAMIDQWNVSPKLGNSRNARDDREVPESLYWFARQPGAYWKFVVTDRSDIDEVDVLVGRYCVPPERVMLMPEAVDHETLLRRSTWLVEACCQRGYRFNTRLHVALWGTERGR